jgi:hypothetical protein
MPREFLLFSRENSTQNGSCLNRDVHLNGSLLVLYRMPDATIFCIDVAVSKAKNVIYFTVPRGAIDLPGVPAGTAVAYRTISFGAQRFFTDCLRCIECLRFAWFRGSRVMRRSRTIMTCKEGTLDKLLPDLETTSLHGQTVVT